MQVKTFTPEELKVVLDTHWKWLRGEEGGERANLSGANLSGANLSEAYLSEANLSGANLRGANLSGANLSGAYLREANLRGANLRGANLRGANLSGAYLSEAYLSEANLSEANLSGANLSGAYLPTGETWGAYLADVVPELCKAGGVSLDQVAASWSCHEWGNCPMHAAFGASDHSDVPALLRPRSVQFVQLFDAGLIPPLRLEGDRWTCLPLPKATTPTSAE